MTEENHLLTKCRVCLMPTGMNPVSLFENYKNSALFVYINLLTDISIKEGDGFPSNICKACFLELQTAINFKEKCQQSNLILHSNSDYVNFYGSKPEIFVKKEVDKVNFDSGNFENEINYCLENIETPLIPKKCTFLIENNAIDTDTKKNCKRESRAVDLKLECHDCGSLFKSKCKLRVHWKKIHLPDSLVCPDCKRIFHKFKPFLSHKKNPPQSCIGARSVRVEGKGKSRVFHCKECDYKTTSADSSLSHLVVHTGDKKYKCEPCQKFYSQVGALLSHKEMVHNQFRVQVTCQFCGKEVKGRDRWYRHMKSHKDNRHTCSVCHKVLSSSNTLHEHMRRHKGVKEFTCHICAQSFFTACELSTHVRKRHTILNPTIYSCDICNYKTKEKYVLKKHKARHTEKNFACGICNSFFDEEEKMKKHQKNHVIKNFKCDICDAKFAFKKSLWRHKKMHSKLTSFTKSSLTIKTEISADSTEGC